MTDELWPNVIPREALRLLDGCKLVFGDGAWDAERERYVVQARDPGTGKVVAEGLGYRIPEARARCRLKAAEWLGGARG